MSHACAPHDDHADAAEVCCLDADGRSSDSPDPCSHESDCSSDPCRLDVTAREPHCEAVDVVLSFDCPSIVLTANASIVLHSYQSFADGAPDERGPASVEHPIILPLLN